MTTRSGYDDIKLYAGTGSPGCRSRESLAAGRAFRTAQNSRIVFDPQGSAAADGIAVEGGRYPRGA